ncbi:hypothetical protein [Reinekea sp.]|jgi:hypothetical protein|uniref:hypothetical protein n=1 Tax=Reinekea sp. TaxID=1970455 RepID=UPI00398A1DB3
MVNFSPEHTLNHLSRLQVQHVEMLNAAGSIPIQLCTDIELAYPHYFEHKEIVTHYHCDSPMPVTLNPMAEITGNTPSMRCNQLLSLWLSECAYKNEALAMVFVLCPIDCNTSLVKSIFVNAKEIHICHQSVAYLQAIDYWIRHAEANQMCLVITVDSLVDLAEFSQQQSPLFHDLNPDGLIASEGLTAIRCSVAPEVKEPVLIADEPFYQKADTEVTETLTQLFSKAEDLSPSLISNHGIDTNANHEVYRAIPAHHLIQIRKSLGDSGLNELGLAIALAASRSQWTEHDHHGVLWFNNQSRLLWPKVYSENTESTNQGRNDE